MQLLFSLRNDVEDHLRRLLHTNCSRIHRDSSRFICANQIYSHLEFHLDSFLVPYQLKSNSCGILFKYHQLLNSNQSVSPRFTSTYRSILSIDKNHWNRSLMITIINRISKANFCSFRLLPIGLNCSIARPIDLHNISCVFKEKLSPFKRMEITGKYLYANQILDQNSDGKNLMKLFLTMFLLTGIPLSFLICNERIEKKMPNYLKYFHKQVED